MVVWNHVTQRAVKTYDFVENYNLKSAGMEESKVMKVPQKVARKDVIKIQFDESGTFLLTSSTDKYVRIWDVGNSSKSFKCVARLSSGEITTGFCISHDNTMLITSTGDGCLFYWRIPEDMTNVLNRRLDLSRKKQALPGKLKAGLPARPKQLPVLG